MAAALAQLNGASGTTGGADRGFGGVGDPRGGDDGFASGDADFFPADAEQGSGYSFPATVEGVWDFLRTTLKDLGLGSATLGNGSSGLDRLVNEVPGTAMTLEAVRHVGQTLDADEGEMDGVTGELWTGVLSPFLERHVGNRTAFADLPPQFLGAVLAANGLPPAERRRRHVQSMEDTMARADRVLVDEATSIAGTVVATNRLTERIRGVGSDPPPPLTWSSSRREVAARIVWEAQRRGYSREETIATLATAMQESSLNPRTPAGDGGRSHGLFQQDRSYPGRNDPNRNIAGFFDRLDAKRASNGASGDIWENIFWLQQRPSEQSAQAAVTDHRARLGFMNEIKSRVPSATKLYNNLAL